MFLAHHDKGEENGVRNHKEDSSSKNKSSIRIPKSKRESEREREISLLTK